MSLKQEHEQVREREIELEPNLNGWKKISKSRILLAVIFFGVIIKFLYVFSTSKAVAIVNHANSTPVFPFDLFSKCYVAEDKCPNENVTFWLYTR